MLHMICVAISTGSESISQYDIWACQCNTSPISIVIREHDIMYKVLCKDFVSKINTEPTFNPFNFGSMENYRETQKHGLS